MEGLSDEHDLTVLQGVKMMGVVRAPILSMSAINNVMEAIPKAKSAIVGHGYRNR